MSELENKYITELAQIRNIIEDNCELAQYLLSEHVDLAGALSVSEYSRLTGISTRTIQDRIKKNKLKHLDICGVKFPYIN